MHPGASFSAALLALALWVAPASADPPGAAFGLFASGRYVAAAELAERQPESAESLALAARSLLAACLTRTGCEDVESALARAERSAHAALALDAQSVAARLQLAAICGIRGRRASTVQAFAQGYAPRGRRLIEQALAIAPDNAEAHALLGAWHLEVLRRGGAMGAMVYGARLSEGLAEFESARALAPHNATIALHYGVSLLTLDARAHRVRAAQVLAAIATMAPVDALERHSWALAARLRRILESEGPRAAARAAADAMP